MNNKVCAAALSDYSVCKTIAGVYILVLVLVQLLVIQGLPGIGR